MQYQGAVVKETHSSVSHPAPLQFNSIDLRLYIENYFINLTLQAFVSCQLMKEAACVPQVYIPHALLQCPTQ